MQPVPHAEGRAGPLTSPMCGGRVLEVWGSPGTQEEAHAGLPLPDRRRSRALRGLGRTSPSHAHGVGSHAAGRPGLAVWASRGV